MSPANKTLVWCTTVALTIISAASWSHGSSPDAWAEFHADVAKVCKAVATSKGLADIQIVVNQLGSESFGVGILRAKNGPKGAAGVYACIYDKKTKRAEVTASFDQALPRP